MALDPTQVAESYRASIEAAEKLQSLREKELKTLQAQAELEEKIKEFKKNETQFAQETLKVEQQIESVAALRVKYQEEMKNNNTVMATQTKTQLDSEIQILNQTKAALDSEKQKVKVFEQQINAIINVGKALTKSFEDGENAAKKFFGVSENGFLKLAKESPEKAQKMAEGFASHLLKIETVVAGLQKSMSIVGKSLLDGFNIPLLGTRIEGMRDMMTGILKAPAEAFKSFGFIDQYTGSINNMRQSMREAGVSEKEMYQAFGELNQVVGDFSNYSKGTQESIAGTSAKLALAGFNSKTTATNFNNLIKVFGQTKDQANETNIRLASLSKTLGDGTKSAEDFAALTPKLTGFGSRSVDVFEKTAIAAKKLGIETKELFNLMDQYDSFEKAADAAGELNVALGGQFVDSLELMQASLEGGPMDTLKVLQKGFEESGRSVDNLSRAELKYFAAAAKMSEADFVKIFKQGSAGIEEYVTKQEAAEKKQRDLNLIAEKTQDIFQKIQNAFNKAFADPKVIKSLTSMVEMIAKMSKTLANILPTVINLLPLFGGLFAAGKVFQVVGGIIQLTKALKVMGLVEAAITGAKVSAAAANPLTIPLAIGALAVGGAAYYGISSMINSAESEGTKGGGVAPQPKEDVSVGGGAIIQASANTKYKTDPKDTIIAAKPDGEIAELLRKVHDAVKQLSNRPVDVNVSLDARQINTQLQMENSRNPYKA